MRKIKLIALFAFALALEGFATRRQTEAPPSPASSAEVRTGLGQDLWGLDRIDQPFGTDGRYVASGTGSGVTIYIVGTGVRSDHQDFAGRVAYVGDFCTGTVRTHSVEVDPEDGFDGHDTHVASYAAGQVGGVARGARVSSLRTTWSTPRDASENGGTECDGGSDHAVASAIEWITAHGERPGVINYSGGSGDERTQTAILQAITVGFTVVLSGYTGGLVSSHWGSAVPKAALVVGATDRADTALATEAYDRSDQLLALYAPGQGLRGAGKAAPDAYSIPEAAEHSTRGGDSFATGLVSGAAALYLEKHPDAPPCEVRQAIIGSAVTGAVRFRAAEERSANRLLHLPLSVPTRRC
jgi:subtilisin family serine protease